jgi:hypothetical protein
MSRRSIVKKPLKINRKLRDFATPRQGKIIARVRMRNFITKPYSRAEGLPGLSCRESHRKPESPPPRAPCRRRAVMAGNGENPLKLF